MTHRHPFISPIFALFLRLRPVLSIPSNLVIFTITTRLDTQLDIWLSCKVSGPTITESVDSYCFQHPLEDKGAELVGGLSRAIAWVVRAAEMLYIGLCNYGIVGRRREAKLGLPLQMESRSEREPKTSEA